MGPLPRGRGKGEDDGECQRQVSAAAQAQSAAALLSGIADKRDAGRVCDGRREARETLGLRAREVEGRVVWTRRQRGRGRAAQ